MALHTMRAGCSHSRGGAYPPFQHKSNVYSLASPRGNNVTPVGRPHLSDDDGMQTNMVESQLHGGVKAVNTSAQRQQDNAQTRQISHGPHHQQMLQARRESPGFQLSHSLPHPTAQLGCLETSAGQQMAYSKPNFTGHFLQGFISNNNTDLQQRQHSSFAYSAGTNSPELNGGALGVSAQGHRCSSAGKVLPPTDDQIQDFITERLNYLKTLESNNADHPHHSTTSASDKKERPAIPRAEQRTAEVGRAHQKNSSRGSNANAEFTMKSKDTGDCPTIADKYSTGTILTATGNSGQMHLHQPLSVDNDASVDFDYPGKVHLDMMMPTNGICKPVHSYYTEDKTIAGSNDESFQGQLGDKYSQNGEVSLHYSLPALKELVDSLDKVETIAKRDDLSKLILKQYWNGDIGNLHLFTFTEYPQIMAKVAATCTKNEDKSPLVVPVSKITWNPLTKEEPSLMPNCSSSKGEETSHWWNNNNSSGEMDSVSQRALNQMTEEKKGDKDLKSVEGVELDNDGLDKMQDATASEDFQTKTSSVVTADKTLILTSLNCENEDTNKNRKRDTEDQHCPPNCEDAITHSKKKSSVALIHNVISVPTDQRELHKDVMEKAGSQTDSSQTLSKKIPNPSLSPESTREDAFICKDPRYDDISDEDTQHQLVNLPNTEHKKSNFTPCFDDPQYEDLSEDDSQQIEETSSFTQVGEANNKQSPLKNEVHRCVQSQAAMETEIISDGKLITKEQISPKTGTPSVAQHHSWICSCETDDRLCPKCDHERHLGLSTNHSASCCPSSVLLDEDDTDDEMDDDYIVIPISLTDIKFEAEDKAHDAQEVVVLSSDESGDEDRHSATSSTHCDLDCPVPIPDPAPAFPTLEVFDTLTCFMRAINIETNQGLVWGSNRTTPEHKVQSKGEQHAPQTRREPSPEPEDSCDTEDSSDYSCASEHNYMTVPKQMFESEQESKHDEARNVEKGEARTTGRLSELSELKARSSCPKNDVIIIDSDTDDESDQNGRMETAKSRVPAKSSLARQHRPELVKAPSEPVKCETNREKHSNKGEIGHSHSEDEGQTTSKRKVSHGSSKVVNNHNQISKRKDMTMVSPVSKDDVTASVAVRKRPTSESVSHLSGPVKKKPELVKAPAEPVKRVSNRKKTSNKEVIHSYSEDDRQTTSKRKVSHGSSKVVNNHNQISKRKDMTMVSPVSKDDVTASVAVQKRPTSESVNHLSGPVKKKPKENVSLSYASPKKQPQSVQKVADSISGPSPGVSRLWLEKSSVSSKHLKLSKDSDFQRQTPKTHMATRKRSDSCENNTQHSLRDEQEKVVPKPKPANDRHCTANKVRTNVTKPALSRQLSLPSTSSSSSATTSGRHPEARRSSESSRSGEKTASPSPPKTMQSTSLPQRHSSPTGRKCSDSSCTSSTLDHPSTTKRPSSNAPIQSSWEKMRKYWRDNYFPTRRDKKSSMGTERALRTTRSESRREMRSRPHHYEKAHHQRHSSHESATPLMKRSMMEARELTKARNRDIIRGPRPND